MLVVIEKAIQMFRKQKGVIHMMLAKFIIFLSIFLLNFGVYSGAVLRPVLVFPFFLTDRAYKLTKPVYNHGLKLPPTDTQAGTPSEIKLENNFLLPICPNS